jgi:hypothetical protein
MQKKLHPAVRAYLRGIASKGGKRGGPARARALTPARRSEIARKAALARWANVAQRKGVRRVR